MDFFLRCTLWFLSGSTCGFPLWFRCRWVFQLGREATQERCLVYRLHLLSCSRNKCLLAARGRVRLREVPDVNWQAWRLKNPRTTGYLVATRTTKRKTPLLFR